MGSLIATTTLAGEPPGTIVSLRAQDGHGRAFDLTSLRGRVVAVTFASRYTRDEADRVHAGLLEHAAQGDMLVVNVVDLMGVPGLFHGYARRKAAEHDEAGRIVHVIDEHGDLRRSFGAEPGKHVDILVVDREGQLRGRFNGAAELEAAVRLVDQLRTRAAENAR
jgi:hypothetical protein